MLTSIELTGFKAFADVRLELRPLTFFLGPNNTGKSSILAAVRLLAQTLDAADPRVALLLDGPLGDFGTFKDVVYGNDTSDTFTIALAGEHNVPLLPAPVSESYPSSWGLKATFGYRSRRRQLILSEVELSDAEGHIVTLTYVPGSDRHVISRMDGREIPSRFRASTARNLGLGNFVPFLTYYRRDRTGQPPLGGIFSDDDLSELDFRVDRAGWAVRQTLRDTEYLSAMRSPPERTYHQTGEGRQRIGASGENWAGILVLDSSRAGAGSRKLTAQLGNWLKSAGLASEVRLHWLSDRHYEVQIRHPITGEIENLADVGQGNSQVIPVLLGGFRLSPGSLYLVEEPEIHLHPKAQAELGDFFGGLRRAGVQTLVETHSEYLLLRVQQQVAATDLDPDSVAFYYVYATRGGRKRARQLTLDSKARFTEPVNGGFFPERLEEARKLARLRA